MRILLLLRGAPGCGKSTWIEQNGLKRYALSADELRIMCQDPQQNVSGGMEISQKNDTYVWKTLFNILEMRMQKGCFTVIDATNSKTAEIKRYKDLCETYKYRIYCVDMSDVPIEEAKRRNAQREPYKRVPEEVIDKCYSRIKTQKIPSGVTVLKPDELDKIWMRPIDLSEYRKIHHIGDIHGCYTVLKKYLDVQGGLKDDEFYIFLGDYLDRGIENVEVLRFMMSIADKRNVLLLEGNHERWLLDYGQDKASRSKEFETVTKPQFLEAKISRKDVRKFYKRLGQCAYYTYGDKTFLVTHGGLSTLPENISLIDTEQMIKGVGNYNDFEAIAETFLKTTSHNVYQIHGHRNTKHVDIRINERVFNLEGRVEFGGELRCLQVDQQGIWPYSVVNTVYKLPEEKPVEDGTVASTIAVLRANKYIQEKTFGNISSFNFTPQAFQKGIWNDQTTKARGLYIDTVKDKVVARAYNKFFNVNEQENTKFDMLQNKLKFPVSVYVKENGFLGIVSYNEYTDDLIITSKSDMEGMFSGYLKNMLYSKISQENILKLKEYVKENDVSFVFECVDMENDPHIIEYAESKLVLLDIVYNTLEFKKYSYAEMCATAEKFGMETKELACEIATWQEFYDWYYEILEPTYEYNGKLIEGFVIEDSDGFMIKRKLDYYNFWKFMRSIAHEAIRSGGTARASRLITPLANEFYAWVRKFNELPKEEREQLPKDICTLRKMFYRSKGGA